jgi:hypothetical protein
MNRTEDQHHTGQQAAQLAAQMTDWLSRTGPSPVYPSAPQITPPAAMSCWASPELVTWCQAARDLLAEVAEQAPKSYSPEAAPRQIGDRDESTLAASMAAEGVSADTSNHYPVMP